MSKDSKAELVMMRGDSKVKQAMSLYENGRHGHEYLSDAADIYAVAAELVGAEDELQRRVT